MLEGGGGASECPTHINAVARSGARSQNCRTLRYGTEHHYIRHNALGRLGGVSAVQAYPKVAGESEQSVHKLVDPALGNAARQGERKESGDGLASHGRNIAQAARQTAMADRFRRLPVAAKMDPFEAEVRGDQNLMVAGQAQHGAVVADSSPDPGWAGRLAANAGNQGLFGKGQGSTIA